MCVSCAHVCAPLFHETPFTQFQGSLRSALQAVMLILGWGSKCILNKHFPCSRNRQVRSLAKAGPKRCGLSWNPCGKTVQVSCCWCLVPSQAKANKNGEEGLRSIQKEASFKSRTENNFVSGCISLWIICGFGTIGWRGITASLMILRSWANLLFPRTFLYGEDWGIAGRWAWFNSP